MNEYILQQFNKYHLEIEDAIKLIYQGTLGVSHLIKNEDVAYKYLEDEYNSIKNVTSPCPLVEKISNDYSRLHLMSLNDSGLTLNTLFKMFLISSTLEKDEKSFFDSLNKLISYSKKKMLPIDYNKLVTFLENYKNEGYPPISHSLQYKHKYQPHYRVISNQFADNIEVFCKIDKLLGKKSPVVICIDGKCGGGKSYLANTISKVYDAPIIRGDDYFLPKQEKSANRMKEIGGNIHYEKMKREVFDNLDKDSVTITPFDCSSQSYLDKVVIPIQKLVIIEGSYVTHPYFEYKADLVVFVDVDNNIQQERILNRNGDVMLGLFNKYWIPMENAFFEKYKTKELADIICFVGKNY